MMTHFATSTNAFVPSIEQQPRAVPVTVTDLDIPFFQLVWLLIKVALASIPAAIILFIVFAIFWSVAFVILGVLGAAVSQ